MSRQPFLIAFDLDGTLIDSRRDLADATNAMLVEFGGTPQPEPVLTAMVGDGAAVLVRRALEAAALTLDPAPALARFLEIYESCLLAHTRAYDGTVDMLQQLYGAGRLAVLTNKPSRATHEILHGLGLLSFFADVIGGDTPLGRKPDPAGLASLIARAGTRPAQTMLVGDSTVDRETARRAGTAVCLARYGFGYRFAPEQVAGIEHVIDSPSELPALIERWQGLAARTG